MRPITKKGFTLIEMLIVIVIIGVLAAALIPRLSSARGKANDTARKADLQQIATALIAYQMDQNEYPPIPVHLGDATAQGGSNGIQTLLMRGGLTNIPRDPANAVYTQTGNNIGMQLATSTTGIRGNYLYTPVIKNGITSGGFVLMSLAETEGGANYVVCGSAQIINGASEIREGIGTGVVKLCKSITKGTACLGIVGGVETGCTYQNASQLRYVYVY